MEASTIIVMVCIGIAMLVAEMFVPGMVMGIVGGLVLLTAVVFTYIHFSFMAGTLLLCGLGILACIGFMLWLKYLPRSFVGRKMALNSSIHGTSADAGLQVLLGKEGVAHSQLRPSGVALFDGKRVDVITNGEFIAPGATIRVERVEGAAVVVRSV